MDSIATNKYEEMYLEVLHRFGGEEFLLDPDLATPLVNQKIETYVDFEDEMAELDCGYVEYIELRSSRVTISDEYFKYALELFFADMLRNPYLGKILSDSSTILARPKVQIPRFNRYKYFRNYLLDLMSYKLDEDTWERFQKYRNSNNPNKISLETHQAIAPIIRDFVNKAYGDMIIGINRDDMYYFIFKLDIS